MEFVQLVYNVIACIILVYAILHIEKFPLYTPDGVHYVFFMFKMDLILVPLTISMYMIDKSLFWVTFLGLIVYNIGACQGPRVSPVVLILCAISSLYLLNS
jgi:hypothetical protein